MKDTALKNLASQTVVKEGRKGSHFMLLDLLSGLFPLGGEPREEATKLTPQQASRTLGLLASVIHSLEV